MHREHEQQFTPAEQRAMQLAIDSARKGVRGANPLVGAVILDEAGEVLSVGYHRGAGTPHAERDALANAASRRAGLSGCTMVVTLEPCNHFGRTGPCSVAVRESGIARLVYAVGDSHAAAAGGAALLAEAGIDVAGGLLRDAALELNHRWFDSVASGRPFITVKLAQTVDARIAAADGTSQWITGPEARADSQQLRARIDAILVGTGTALADNPRLTARDRSGTELPKQPLRVVMGQRELPADAAVRGGDTEFVHFRTHDPAEVAAALYQRGVRHLLVEGGATATGAFIAAGLADELFVYLAPSLLGAGTASVQDLGIGTLADAQQWRWDAAGGGFAVPLGRDIRLHLEPEPALRADDEF